MTDSIDFGKLSKAELKSFATAYSETTGKKFYNEHQMNVEANKIAKENIELVKNGKKEKDLPYKARYKACEAFKLLTNSKRQTLLKNIRINTGMLP